MKKTLDDIIKDPNRHRVKLSGPAADVISDDTWANTVASDIIIEDPVARIKNAILAAVIEHSDLPNGGLRVVLNRYKLRDNWSGIDLGIIAAVKEAYNGRVSDASHDHNRQVIIEIPKAMAQPFKDDRSLHANKSAIAH